MTRVQIIAGLVPTIPHNDLIVPPPPSPNHRTLPSPSSFLPINLHSIARLINDVKGVLGREPGPRHLAYCLSASPPFSLPPSFSLVRNYSATMNQPSCQPFSDRQPIIHPTPSFLRYSVIGEARIMIGGLSAPSLLRCLFPQEGGGEDEGRGVY